MTTNRDRFMNDAQFMNDKAIEVAKNFHRTGIFILSLPKDKVRFLNDDSLMRIFKLEFNNYLCSQNVDFKI